MSNRTVVVIAMMMGTFLVAVDATIVDTVMPQIIGSLGGFEHFTWVFSAYLLTSAATVPVYGKLADLLGRRRVFLFGAGLFVTGSMLCGLATTMEQLILLRGLQGLGAGAVLPVTQTVIGDMFDPEERARIQGVFAMVWGVAGTSGPLLGGLVADYLSWRWIFFFNLPVGAAALLAFAYALRREGARRPAHVDYGGFFTLTAGVVLLLLALLTGGIYWPWASMPVLGLLAAGSVMLGVFWFVERRAADPMLPFALLRRRGIVIPYVASFLSGAIVIGVTVYVPLLVQGVHGVSATRAGMVLVPLSITWPVSAFVSGLTVLRFGYRRSVVWGMAVNMASAAALWHSARLGETAPLWVVSASGALLGVGMGFSIVALLLMVQNDVEWHERGTATGFLQFSRNLGRTIGVSAMGALLNWGLVSRLHRVSGLEGTSPAGALAAANRLLSHAGTAGEAPAELALRRAALAEAMGGVYVLMFAIAMVGFLVTLGLPHVRVRLVARPQPPPQL